jgi:hypothetical protein
MVRLGCDGLVAVVRGRTDKSEMGTHMSNLKNTFWRLEPVDGDDGAGIVGTGMSPVDGAVLF